MRLCVSMPHTVKSSDEGLTAEVYQVGDSHSHTSELARIASGPFLYPDTERYLGRTEGSPCREMFRRIGP